MPWKEYPVLVQSWFPGIGASVLVPDFPEKQALKWARQRLSHWNEHIHPKAGEILHQRAQCADYWLFGILREGKEADFGRSYTEIRAVLGDKLALLPSEKELEEKLLGLVLSPDQSIMISLPCQEAASWKRTTEDFSNLVRKRYLKIACATLCFATLPSLVAWAYYSLGSYFQKTALPKESPPLFRPVLVRETPEFLAFQQKVEGWRKKSANPVALLFEGKEYARESEKFSSWGKQTIEEKLQELKKDILPPQRGSYEKESFLQKFPLWKEWAKRYGQPLTVKISLEIFSHLGEESYRHWDNAFWDKTPPKISPDTIQFAGFDKESGYKIHFQGNWLEFLEKEKITLETESREKLYIDKRISSKESNKTKIEIFLISFQANLHNASLRGNLIEDFKIRAFTIQFMDSYQYSAFCRKILDSDSTY